MKFLLRLLHRFRSTSNLAPLHDNILGELCWDAEMEGWSGSILGPDGPAQILIVSGSPREYPAKDLLETLSTPCSRFDEFTETAREFVRAQLAVNDQKDLADELAAQSLEIYAQNPQTYLISFVHDDTESVWSVHFENHRPVRYEVDA